MGIGVNTGEAVVGNIGSEQRAKYAVVGSAVNVAARVEGATVGGQIFLTAATYERIREVAVVDPPVHLQMKGLSEPLALYELHRMGGSYAPADAEREPIADRDVAVSMPIRCQIVDGKVIGGESIGGHVVRLGRRELVARLDVGLPAFTNVRFRLTYPQPSGESDDIYGKVTREEHGDAGPLTRIRFTSVTDTDTQAFEAIVGAAPR
jgi:adenylate cyclase